MPKKYIGIAGNPDGGWPYYMEYNPTVFSPYPTDMYDKKYYGLEGNKPIALSPVTVSAKAPSIKPLQNARELERYKNKKQTTDYYGNTIEPEWYNKERRDVTKWVDADLPQEVQDKNFKADASIAPMGDLRPKVYGDWRDYLKYAPLAIMAAPAVLSSTGAAAIGSVLTNPWVDAGISSYFGAQIPGNLQRGEYAEAALNAIPFAGLGYRAVKPIYNAAKESSNFLFNTPSGRLIQKEIPYNPENFYRGVDKAAIQDANESGLIRTANPDAFSGPFFSKGKDPWNKEAVIEGTPNSVDWIAGQRYEGWHQYPYMREKYDSPIMQVPEEAPTGYEAFPWANGSTTVPTDGFSYWQKHPIIGWRQHQFKTPTYRMGNAEKFDSSNTLIKDIFDNANASANLFKTQGAVPMDIPTRRKGYERMIEFITSPEYEKRLEEAGLGKYRDYMINLIENRMNQVGYFPARRADIIRGRKGVQGMSDVNMHNSDYGVTIKKDLTGDDFLQTFDHELAHWSTENTEPNIFRNFLESITSMRFPNLKLHPLMKYNDAVSPVRSWKDYYNSRFGNYTKKELKQLTDKIKSAKHRFKYIKSGQERRARAYAMTQEAKRKGITTDELIDQHTVNGEISDSAPSQLRDLGMVYSPENMKKYFKKFLSIGVPTTLGIEALINQNFTDYE